jgi:hypothetical protein
MRLQTTITGMTAVEWKFAQEVLRTEYTIGPDASRVCLTLEHEGEERHAEMPLGAFVGFVAGLGVNNTVQTVLAALSPDELPDHLEDQRNAADPTRAAERAGGPCPENVPDCPIKHADQA